MDSGTASLFPAATAKIRSAMMEMATNSLFITFILMNIEANARIVKRLVSLFWWNPVVVQDDSSILVFEALQAAELGYKIGIPVFPEGD